MSQMQSNLMLALVLPLSVALAPAIDSSAHADTVTEGAFLLDPPAAPSNCKQKTTKLQDGEGHTWYFSFVSWTDNSTTEDGFTVETWRNQAGGWVLAGSQNRAANSTGAPVTAGQGYKFRVKAFNASGDSAWSNWAH